MLMLLSSRPCRFCVTPPKDVITRKQCARNFHRKEGKREKEMSKELRGVKKLS